MEGLAALDRHRYRAAFVGLNSREKAEDMAGLAVGVVVSRLIPVSLGAEPDVGCASFRALVLRPSSPATFPVTCLPGYAEPAIDDERRDGRWRTSARRKNRDCRVGSPTITSP